MTIKEWKRQQERYKEREREKRGGNMMNEGKRENRSRRTKEKKERS